MNLENKLKTYYITAILGVVFAVVGFSYNAWRLEATEANSNIRTASFEVLKELAELEQIIYSGYYDHDHNEGNPRKGWVKVGLIVDLSSLISNSVNLWAKQLHHSWSQHWNRFSSEQTSTDQLISDIEQIRSEIKLVLKTLN